MKKIILAGLIYFTGFQLGLTQIIQVSEDNRYFTTQDGKPFLWIGDTAWELFHKLNREDAVFYLENRAKKGFTVIQAVIIAERNGLRSPNAYGDLPLLNMDPTQPNEKYFQHVDFIIEEAEKLGMVVGLLPTWGDKVTSAGGGGPVVFNPDNAFVYGKFLGERYLDKSVVWILGGDRNIQSDEELETWRAMAKGLQEGDQGKHLITYHPAGAKSSHEQLQHEPWMDFNVYQSGHSNKYTRVYRYAETLQNIEPRKPFIDIEPAYEDIPVEFWKYMDWSTPLGVPADVLKPDKTIAKKDYFEKGFFDAHDIRVHGYWNILAGACGYTYGNNAIWQMVEKNENFAIPVLYDWKESLDRPGAESMTYLKKIFEKRPFHKLRPAQDLIIGENPTDSLHIRAAMADNKSFMLFYASVGQPIEVSLAAMNNKVKAYWYNPGTGASTKIGKFNNTGTKIFTPPDSGTGNDWLLVIDDIKSKLKKL